MLSNKRSPQLFCATLVVADCGSDHCHEAELLLHNLVRARIAPATRMKLSLLLVLGSRLCYCPSLLHLDHAMTFGRVILLLPWLQNTVA